MFEEVIFKNIAKGRTSPAVTSFTVQHLRHGHNKHLHISSSTSSFVTSSNTTSTITSTNQNKTISKQMFIQSSSLSEWFVTLSTWVQLLSSMNEQMSTDASSLSEYLFAFCATVWILSTVMEYICFFKLSASLCDSSRWPQGWGFSSL